MGMQLVGVLNSVMQTMVNFWKHEIKEVFEEPKNSEVFKQVFDNFSEKMSKSGTV